MKRTAYINLCFWLTLIGVGVALALKYTQTPEAPGRAGLSLLAPIFFVIAAKRASHSRASGPLATVGLLFAGLAVYAVLTGAALHSAPAPSTAPSARPVDAAPQPPTRGQRG
ncbi:hypothetical protein KKF91_11520 [Myxococcota bacterium]|nr:hypothetical protein [Myxococcota bacterium]MBU1431157.1 hypothetical protein [Myxococcota bacterium]MBU1897488.1 hypothetical protein [Myxococcota bacterium]